MDYNISKKSIHYHLCGARDEISNMLNHMRDGCDVDKEEIELYEGIKKDIIRLLYYNGYITDIMVNIKLRKDRDKHYKTEHNLKV